MAQAKHTSIWARSVGFSVAAILAVALFSAGGVAHAACPNCTFSPGAGTGNSGLAESGFGDGALNDGPNSGNENTAIGAITLQVNTTGSDNTATGWSALNSNTVGANNTATGFNALAGNNTGDNNTATGFNALAGNNTGSNNIALGYNAGSDLTDSDSNNIDIGSAGVANDSGTIRIGIPGQQSQAFIQGVFTKSVGNRGTEVYISNTGQLGTKKSSARYKRDIHDMGDASAKLMKLRPVTFRYKDDPDGTRQFGLVAEEVARVYPELVVRDADGKVESVQYSELTGMLLNEVQKQAKEGKQKDSLVAALQRRIVSQQQQIDALKKKDGQIDALVERMNALERQARLARPEHLASAMR